MKSNNIHEDFSEVQIEEVMSNVDNPLRHNVGGAMNRPPRNLDPVSPRNIPHPHDEVKLPEENFSAKVMRNLDDIYDLLVSKNKKYGNSALDPVRIFSKTDSAEQIKVRIDDKLSRMKTASDLEDEDIVNDLIGYLILLKISNEKH